MNNEKNEMSVQRTVLAAVLCTLLAGSAVSMSACNTVEGAGRDVEAVGDGVADTARDAQD